MRNRTLSQINYYSGLTFVSCVCLVLSVLQTQHQQAIQGTVIYLSLYYLVFIPFQSFSKFYIVWQKKEEAKCKDGNVKVSFRKIKYYNSTDLLALNGDRTVGNFMEYAIIFLPLMWIHAVFIDPTKSFTICLLYTISRLFYPILYQKGFLVALSTTPGYLINTYLLYEVAKYAFTA